MVGQFDRYIFEIFVEKRRNKDMITHVYRLDPNPIASVLDSSGSFQKHLNL